MRFLAFVSTQLRRSSSGYAEDSNERRGRQRSSAVIDVTTVDSARNRASFLAANSCLSTTALCASQRTISCVNYAQSSVRCRSLL